MIPRILRGVPLFVSTALLLGACASPAERIRDQAIAQGFRPVVLESGGFNLRGYIARGATGSKRLHIYIEGDGTPWKTRQRISRDPTSRNPLMLRLMALDSAPSLYLGRPCYLGEYAAPNCNPVLWTHQRYSRRVVSIMTTALRGFLADSAVEDLYFFGHSGGGTLAVLIAREFESTRAVVTLAANLDTDQWARYHGFSRLEGSLNPAALPPLRNDIQVIHFLGGADSNIRPEFMPPAYSNRVNVRVENIPEADHTCCWQRVWPALLKSLNPPPAEPGA